MAKPSPASPPRPATYRVLVKLSESEPEIWRLIDLDADLTLDRVHDALQIVMGWSNSHLHEFSDTDPLERAAGRVRFWGPAEEADDGESTDPEEGVTLRSVLADQAPLFYAYDFGDGWIHRLDLVEVLPRVAGRPSATVIDGERRGPLEDSGGLWGYEDKLRILADSSDPEHDEITEWVAEMNGNTGQPFDPAAFDKEAVNDRLGREFGTGR